MRSVFSFYLIFLLSLLGAAEAMAQFDQERFGKNRVQHKEIKWYYYTSANFEVYYYDRGGPMAKMAIEFLEADFNKLTQNIGYVAYTKPKIYIYNSPEERLQSNLDLNAQQYTEEGQTKFSRLIAEVAYKGRMDVFKEDLLFATSQVIIREMLYGASVADAFQANLISNFPDWYVDGIALYLAKGWSREMDDYIRHYLKNTSNPKLYALTDLEAGLVGQSIWNFIAEKYGRRYVSSILNLSRINRNEENSIANTIGINIKTFYSDWQQFYLKINEPVYSNFKTPDASKAIASTSSRVNGAISDLKFSPDGLHLAYVVNNAGKFSVIARELSSGMEQRIFQGGAKYEELPPNLSSPVIAWRDSATLAIASFKRGVTTLRQRSLDGSLRNKIFLRNITQVLSMDFNESGKNITLSAISNGKTDIYTLNVRGQGKRLTDDSFDDLNPIFLNDSTIVYATNFVAQSDSLATTPSLGSFPSQYNLYMAQVLQDTTTFTKLTNSNSKNSYPRKLNGNTLVYLSDLSGIGNIMRHNIGNQVSTQISSIDSSIEVVDVNSRMNKLAYAVRNGKESKLYVENYSGVDQFTPSTPRLQLAQAKELNERIAARRLLEAKTQVPTQVQKQEDPELVLPAPALDTLSKKTSSISTDRLRFESKKGINTENYIFDSIPSAALVDVNTPTPKQEEVKNNILESFRKQNLQKRISGPMLMEPQFFTNHINTRFVVDPLRGFGIHLNGKMTDILDNHLFMGGIMTSLDFDSGGDIWFEYEYLKSRLDVRGRYDRKTLRVSEGDISYQKYVLSKLEAGASYPLNVHSRLYAAPFVATTRYYNLNADSIIYSKIPELNRFDVNYVGGKAEFVYDRTEPMGLYSFTGTKGKIGFMHYQGLNHGDRSFSNVYVDLRNYQKIHKNIVLASKFYYGSFMGPNPQNYLVGGMDNWLFNDFYTPPANRPEPSPVRNPEGLENSNILFADFVDLRGFNYDEIRGRNVITFSTELRFPLFSYLTRGNITSNFIKNFQMVGFYDVGSAWNDAAPWEKINDQNTEVINTPGSPFVIVLNNFNNPWLQSYGAGLRTVLMNYYVKFDVARPIRNYQSEDLKFYFTLGYNF